MTAPRLNTLPRALRWIAATALSLTALGASAQQVLRVTAIPDESPTELARKFAPLGQYLESKLAMKVEWTPVTDYAAAVETLVNKKVDLAWFGGFTFVQANIRSGGKAVPIAQREEDEKFRSVFITSEPGINSLADLKGTKMRAYNPATTRIAELAGCIEDSPEETELKGLVVAVEKWDFDHDDATAWR